MSLKRSWTSEILRMMLYVGVGLAVAIMVSVAAWYNVSSGRNVHIPARWAGLAFWTPATFWIAVKPSRKYWRSWTFWLAVTGLLVVHLFAFTIILRSYPHWRPIWFVFTAAAEGVLFSRILGAVFSREMS
jgi:hypothetical protein